MGVLLKLNRDAPMQDIVDVLPSIMALALVEDKDIFSTVEAFRPVIDGDEYKDQPLALIRDGKWQNYKDLIVGTNTQELETIQFYIPKNITISKNIFEVSILLKIPECLYYFSIFVNRFSTTQSSHGIR